MPIVRPSELRYFLASLGVQPKKSLGQNFLIDGNIVRKIIEIAQIAEGEPILEIGPGPGALTEALVENCAQIFAVEKDSVFATSLKKRFPSIAVFEDDILSFPLNHVTNKKKVKVVSNLPYHLTSPILNLLLPHEDIFSFLVLMVQEEMARRITAQPLSSDYSVLSLFVQFYATARYGFGVSRQCFYPVPKVDSAVITLQLKKPPSVDADAFFLFVKSAFQQRRKQIVNSLKSCTDKDVLIQALDQLGIRLDARPEEISFQKFLDLFRLCHLPRSSS